MGESAPDDVGLLRAWAEYGCDVSFAALTKRYASLVNSTARKIVGDPHKAEEVTQSVFVLLAQKASSLPANVVLGGWLYRTTCFKAAQLLRSENRREKHWFAFYWNYTARDEHPLVVSTVSVSEMLHDLNAADRDILMLRFVEGYSLRETGDRLNLSEEAARKRVSRALRRLRSSLEKRGISFRSSAFMSVGDFARRILLDAERATRGISGLGSLLAKVKAIVSFKLVWLTAASFLVFASAPVLMWSRTFPKFERPPKYHQPPSRPKSDVEVQRERMACLDNLKQLAATMNQWAAAHGGKLPTTIQDLSQSARETRLHCPSDTLTPEAVDLSARTAETGYVLLAPGSTVDDPDLGILRCSIHGHLVVRSGRVFQGK